MPLFKYISIVSELLGFSYVLRVPYIQFTYNSNEEYALWIIHLIYTVRQLHLALSVGGGMRNADSSQMFVHE